MRVATAAELLRDVDDHLASRWSKSNVRHTTNEAAIASLQGTVAAQASTIAAVSTASPMIGRVPFLVTNVTPSGFSDLTGTASTRLVENMSTLHNTFGWSGTQRVRCAVVVHQAAGVATSKTCKLRLYNLTDATLVPKSEVTFTGLNAANDTRLMRVTATITVPTGSKTYVVKWNISAADANNWTFQRYDANVYAD